MKNLLACFAVFAAFSAAAQSMPYNPDANDDGYITSPDLLSFLPLYGSQIGIDSSLTCDYDGTPFEEFVFSVIDGEIYIDSILIQYHTIDSALIYLNGCPDPVWDVVSYERAYTVNPNWYGDWGEFVDDRIRWKANLYGKERVFSIYYFETQGHYAFSVLDEEIQTASLQAILGSFYADAAGNTSSGNWSIPFSADDVTYDANGIHFEHWSGFLTNATYVNILPFWHYAE